MVIFINQIRMKIGVMFGNPETTTGGNALKFYASRAPRHPPHRRDQGRRGRHRQPHAREGREEQDGAAVQGGRVRHPLRPGHLAARATSSTSAPSANIVEKSGAWFSFNGERIGQGRENAKQFLSEHPDVAKKIEAKILAHFAIKRDVGGTSLGGGGAARSGGATVHTLNPQPKPASEKKGRECATQIR